MSELYWKQGYPPVKSNRYDSDFVYIKLNNGKIEVAYYYKSDSEDTKDGYWTESGNFYNVNEIVGYSEIINLEGK